MLPTSLLRMERDRGRLVLGTAQSTADLSAAQKTVLELVGRGLTTKSISQLLEISPSTVESHVRAGIERIGARTRVQAAAATQAALQSSPWRNTMPLVLRSEEYRLLELIGAGATMSEAANAIGVSSRTGARRLATAKVKLGAGSTAQAVVEVCAKPCRHRRH